jgi:hypothetical protein
MEEFRADPVIQADAARQYLVMMGAIFVSMKARTCFTTANSSAGSVSMRP